MVDAMYTDDVHDPAEVYRRGEAEIPDDQFLESAIVSSDPEKHVERIRELEEMGATVVGLMNVSGNAPLEALRVYGRDVLPQVRSRAFPVST
jgi:coenzyme F420-dependent glucose-6-phosphate dehydrogenase